MVCGHIAGCAPAAAPLVRCAIQKLVLVPQGGRMIGTDNCWSRDYEQPQTWFRLDYVLYMGRTEVTIAQWERLMGKYDSLYSPNMPVQVTWDQAMEYCRMFEKELARQTGRKWECRLPREYEWEYAACYGSPPTADWWTGDMGWPFYEISEHEWYLDTATGPLPELHGVGLKSPNALGLFDMLGNISEWCDGWFSYDKDVVWMLKFGWQPQSKTDTRPYRGGSYISRLRDCIPCARYGAFPIQNIGFRIVALPK